VIDDMRGHPIRRMLDAGLMATVNSDDPAYFGGYVKENFLALDSALDLSDGEVVTLARNSFEGAFITADAKSRAFARIAEAAG
jgi:adenosine deaminase